MDDAPSDTMRGRAGNRWKLWLLMAADRRLVAGGLAVGVFLTLALASLLGPAPVRRLVAERNALWWLFSPLIGVVVTGVTLVVTIDQLVLSQELGAVGDQRERMRGSLEFREDIEEAMGVAVSPADPASFLAALLDGIRGAANEVAETVADERDEELRSGVERYVDELTEHTRRIGDGLSDAQFGRFGVVHSALNFNYSWKLHEARALAADRGDDLPEETGEALGELIDLFGFYAASREHIKTLYFQWALVDLSRGILYAAVPAIVVTVAMVLYVDAGSFPGATLGVENLAWVISGATTLALLPFLLLLSYILRIATVAKRTLAVGPFVLRDADATDEYAWDCPS